VVCDSEVQGPVAVLEDSQEYCRPVILGAKFSASIKKAVPAQTTLGVVNVYARGEPTHAVGDVILICGFWS
jgi:hypothetical protein